MHQAREAAIAAVLEAYDTMGASIAIVSSGQVVDTFVYGRANRADDIPVTEDTFFKVASLTKMVSALGVLRLVENCQLTLDGDVSDFLPFTVRNPYFPDTPITLRQIMTHTATLLDDYHYQMAVDDGNITPLSTVFEGKLHIHEFSQEGARTVSDYSNLAAGCWACSSRSRPA